MSNFTAIIAVAFMADANALLEEQGFGPDNFSVPAYQSSTASHALLHAWGDPVFQAAVEAIPNATLQFDKEPAVLMTDACFIMGSVWGGDALPLTGVVTPGLYKDASGKLWWVIQQYDTAVYPDPYAIPALIVPARIPGSVEAWIQPLNQYYAYQLLNPFTGKPDRCTHGGEVWEVELADGAGNNIWEPGVYGWKKLS